MSLAVLAIDPGTRTGWALAEDGTVTASGVCDFSDHAGSQATLLDAWDLWIEQVLRALKPAVLVLEDPPTRLPSGHAVQVLVGMRTLALLAAHRLELLVELVPPARWQAWARRQRGWSRARKGDEADARHLLAWWLAERLPNLEVEHDGRALPGAAARV